MLLFAEYIFFFKEKSTMLSRYKSLSLFNCIIDFIDRLRAFNNVWLCIITLFE